MFVNPGAADEQLPDWIRNSGVMVEAILLTHGHFDHSGGGMICDISPTDLSLGHHDIKVVADRYVSEGDIIATKTCSFQIIETPGHSEGRICYLVDDILFPEIRCSIKASEGQIFRALIRK